MNGHEYLHKYLMGRNRLMHAMEDGLAHPRDPLAARKQARPLADPR
jgi:hypothetical protein